MQFSDVFRAMQDGATLVTQNNVAGQPVGTRTAALITNDGLEWQATPISDDVVTGLDRAGLIDRATVNHMGRTVWKISLHAYQMVSELAGAAYQDERKAA